MQLSSVSKSMKISKTHQLFANYLQQDYNIPKQQVLNHPENYLGPNWEKVLEFWCHLDTLTEEQLKVVEDRYFALSKEERDKARDKAYNAARETTQYAGDAGCAAHWSVSYARWTAGYATFELIANVKNPVILPMFYNF